MEDQKEVSDASAKPWAFYHSSFFQYAFTTLLVLLIILVFYHVTVFLEPFLDFISILFAPIVISLLFYYILRPIVQFCEERYSIPRVVTILCIYVLFFIGLVLFVSYIVPVLINQLSDFVNFSSKNWEKINRNSDSLFFNSFKGYFDAEIKQKMLSFAQQLTTALSRNLLDFIAFLTRLATILATIPFIVFYLLKDDKNFMLTLFKGVREDYGREIRKILHNMDLALSNYITGLVMASSIVGGMLFIGYLVIGLNYALILAALAFIFMTIPFFGPFLSIIPALFVGLATSSWMALKVAIVFAIVQQTDANCISPQIIGQRLNIHPLTIILLLLAAGTLYGLPGLFLVTPLYALAKVLIRGVYEIYQWHDIYLRTCSKSSVG